MDPANREIEAWQSKHSKTIAFGMMATDSWPLLTRIVQVPDTLPCVLPAYGAHAALNKGTLFLYQRKQVQIAKVCTLLDYWSYFDVDKITAIQLLVHEGYSTRAKNLRLPAALQP